MASLTSVGSFSYSAKELSGGGVEGRLFLVMKASMARCKIIITWISY